MWFEVLRFRAGGYLSQQRIIEMSLVPKGGFIKAQEQDPGAERAALGSDGVAHYIFQVGSALGIT